MDFEVTYSEEQQRFRQEVRAWLAEHVPPGAARTPVSAEDNYRRYLDLRELGRALGAKGWLFPRAPVTYGGGGLDLDHAVILEEEVDRLDLSLPPYYDSGGRLGAASILVWGTEEQKRAFLPPIYTGQVRTWQLLSEPGAGSDLASVSITALRDGDEYVLNGQKIFVGSDNGADRIWLIACTDPNGRRHENLAWFMIDANLPGLAMQPMELMGTGGEGGTDSGVKNTVFFDGVRVPAFSLDRRREQWLEGREHPPRARARRRRPHRAQPAVGSAPALLPGDQARRRPAHPESGRPGCPGRRVHQGRGHALFGLRNFGLIYSGRKPVLRGPAALVLPEDGRALDDRRHPRGGRPAALTSDPGWGSPDGFLELQQRNGIVAVHPGGTADVQRVSMARRIGIGRARPSPPARWSDMDLALTESQEMLKGIAKSFMAREAPKDVIVGWQNEPNRV